MRARINSEGKIIGTPTPSQASLINSIAFELSVELYKSALEKGQQTAPQRLALINQSLENAAKNDLVTEPSPCYL